MAITRGYGLHLLVFASVTSAASPDPREIIRRAVETDAFSDPKVRNYTYRQRTLIKELDRGGRFKSQESTTKEVIFVYGRPVEKSVAKNDKPLSAEESKKEEERIDKLTRKWSRESEPERRKRLASEAEDERKVRVVIREIPNAYDFKLVGEEVVNGRASWVIDAEPKPGYKPRVPRADLLPKWRGRLWIDQAEYQPVKADCLTIGDISFGLFLARLEKGAHVTFGFVRVNQEVWLQNSFSVNLDARLAMLKRFRRDIEVSNSEFKKFQSDSRLVEVKQAMPEQAVP